MNSDVDVDERTLPSLVLVTGMSGAGRTEAMHVFEDLGYYCVDNLPSSLIGDLLALEGLGDGENRRVAVVCDVRNGDFFGNIIDVLDDLERQNVDFKLLFLDADDDRLVARYKSSRRRHPMCRDGMTITQGIHRERALLEELRGRADVVINTTAMMPQKLRNVLRSQFAAGNERQGLAVTVYSFGFKHGAPTDADLVIDVRFLPNPYYDPALRPLTGLDEPVRDYVMMREETLEFNRRWRDLLDVLMPGYVSEGKQQLAIAIGCTGGQHRSVALAQSTADYLKSKGYRVSLAHRDLRLAQRAAASRAAFEAASLDAGDFGEGDFGASELS